MLVNTKFKLPSNLLIVLTHTPVVLASRLWVKVVPGGAQRRVDGISKRFTGAGWKHLPQELVDEILGYLVDDLSALKACSLTCKHLFGATRPLIHQRLCLPSRPVLTPYPKPRRCLISGRKRGSKSSKLWIDADCSGLLRYTRHITFGVEDSIFYPRSMQDYLPYLRSITKLNGLTLVTFHAHLFIPRFDRYFGMFTNTLRHLDLRNAYATEQQLLYIISRFPLLEDLTIVYPTEMIHSAYPVPTITQSPPLRGKLALARTYSREFFEGLAAFPGGLHFRSLELFRCGSPRAVLTACSHTITSISYLWFTWSDSNGESNLSIHTDVVM